MGVYHPFFCFRVSLADLFPGTRRGPCPTGTTLSAVAYHRRYTGPMHLHPLCATVPLSFAIGVPTTRHTPISLGGTPPVSRCYAPRRRSPHRPLLFTRTCGLPKLRNSFFSLYLRIYAALPVPAHCHPPSGHIRGPVQGQKKRTNRGEGPVIYALHSWINSRETNIGCGIRTNRSCMGLSNLHIFGTILFWNLFIFPFHL